MSKDRLVEVFMARDLAEAHIVLAALEAAGIKGVVTNEHLQEIAGGVPLGASSSPTILVDKSAEDEARAIIAAHDGKHGEDTPDDEES